MGLRLTSRLPLTRLSSLTRHRIGLAKQYNLQRFEYRNHFLPPSPIGFRDRGNAECSAEIRPSSIRCSATTAHADIIFSDDFEATQTIERWQVYQTLSDGEWTVTEGSGVEVQDSVIVDAHSGSQYIELDSSFRRGGTNSTDGTNSAITRELTGLAAGDYLLEYYYQPRTDTIDDNIISVYGDSAQDGELFGRLCR